MNGNVEIIDNAKRVDGKRTDFLLIQNSVFDMLMPDNSTAYLLYTFLLRRGNSEYNLTIHNIIRDLKCSMRNARKAIEVLKKCGLLSQQAVKDLNGLSCITTADGRRVPNNQQQFKLYTVPYNPAQPLPLPTVTPHTSAADKAISKPDRLLSEEPKAVPVSDVEKRKAQILQIANLQGLFGEANHAKLLNWAAQYKKVVGKTADNNAISYMAMQLSGNNNADLTGYLKAKKLGANRTVTI